MSTTTPVTDTGPTTDPVGHVDNGVDVAALEGAREALAAAPTAAQFEWRATTRWINGTHSRSTMHSFAGLGGEQAHRQPFELDADHPEVFASKDAAPTPVETVLAALGSCLTAGIASIATKRGVQLRSVVASIEGDMDIRGILGVDPEVRNGFTGIRVSYEIDADASREEIEGIVAQSQKRSATFDLLTNPTTVTVAVV